VARFATYKIDSLFLKIVRFGFEHIGFVVIELLVVVVIIILIHFFLYEYPFTKFAWMVISFFLVACNSF